MLASFYFFISPLLLVFLFTFYKFFLHKKELQTINGTNQTKFGDEGKNNLDEAKEIVFVFFDRLRKNIRISLNVFSHWILHFFVIFLGLISDLTDVLYAQSRDFFLKTASKEKKTVSTFWHTLIEYKKESEEEKNDEK